MPVLTNIFELNSCRDEGGQGDIHSLSDAAVAWIDGRIEWVGPRRDLPGEYAAYEVVDAGGALVVPGLIDCHTHLAFGGWRADEFELRCRGTTYQEIAAAGGGILNTVGATRAASEDALVARTGAFAREMMRLGVTTIECKSGYGLSTEEERKLLRVYRRLAAELPVEIVPTFLGAHTVPPEYRDRRAAYVELICCEMIPMIASEMLADFCDVFLEAGAFTVSEAREVLNAGAAHGLRPKLHADQLTDGGGALLASEVGAASADHLEFASRRGMRAMAAAGVVAVNLPIAALYLRQPPLDARPFIEEGVPVAVATDFNPGSAPSYHLPLAMTLACTMSRMTPAEALKGATIYAARALNRADRIGSIERGKRADFVLVDATSVNHWLYHFRPNAVRAVYASGIRL
jgi:imidazolonepropionase